MAVDFAKLGKTTIGGLPPPPKEPSGTYVGVIRSWKWAQSRWTNKETSQPEEQIHFTIKPTEFGDDVPDEAREGIVLSEKIHVAEQGIGSDAQKYYMQEFLRSLGVDLATHNTLDTALPETVGATVEYNVVLKDGERGPIVNIRRLRARTA
jgi:hypothetical protein